MSYKFGSKSKERIQGVHPALIECSERALSYGIMDLTVPQFGGLRTVEDQSFLVSKGASKTMDSLHMPQESGYGHAIDLVPYPVDWADIRRFIMMGTLMFRASAEVGIQLEWGGHWNSFKDYPHFQLPRDFK